MKKLNSIIFCLLISLTTYGQYDYEASEEFPFGRPNPEAPEQIKDYQAMIGECHCKSSTRNQDGSWNDDVDMIWRWKYILNGMAIQDETLKIDGGHSGSIRQFVTDSSRWYVHWFSSKTPSTKFPVWEGNKKDDKIILYKTQKAPNGTDGFFRLTFYDMSETGYKWIGEWVDKTESVVFPTWKINCVRKRE